MTEWGKICREIYIWNYNTNFSNYLLPCPNLRVIEPNVRYFLAHGARGIFMQAAGNALGAELSDLRDYLISNLLWDPGRSGGKLLDEFLDLHYGPAAPPIRRFIKFTHETTAASGKHPRCHGSADQFGIDRTIAEEGLKDFAEAMRLADSEKLKARVEKASICAHRAAIEPVWEKKLPLSLHLDEATIRRMRPMVREFFGLCRKHGVTMVSEGITLEESIKHAEAAFNVPPGGQL